MLFFCAWATCAHTHVRVHAYMHVRAHMHTGKQKNTCTHTHKWGPRTPTCTGPVCLALGGGTACLCAHLVRVYGVWQVHSWIAYGISHLADGS